MKTNEKEICKTKRGDIDASLMWYTLAKIAIDWNKTALPDNDLKSQYKKIEEEIIEYISAPNKKEKCKEAADIFVSAVGLFRFCIKDLDEVEVSAKLEKLKRRSWKRQLDGTYHHDNEE